MQGRTLFRSTTDIESRRDDEIFLSRSFELQALSRPSQSLGGLRISQPRRSSIANLTATTLDNALVSGVGDPSAPTSPSRGRIGSRRPSFCSSIGGGQSVASVAGSEETGRSTHIHLPPLASLPRVTREGEGFKMLQYLQPQLSSPFFAEWLPI
jgi:hypothetical protein